MAKEFYDNYLTILTWPSCISAGLSLVKFAQDHYFMKKMMPNCLLHGLVFVSLFSVLTRDVPSIYINCLYFIESESGMDGPCHILCGLCWFCSLSCLWWEIRELLLIVWLSICLVISDVGNPIAYLLMLSAWFCNVSEMFKFLNTTISDQILCLAVRISVRNFFVYGLRKVCCIMWPVFPILLVSSLAAPISPYQLNFISVFI